MKDYARRSTYDNGATLADYLDQKPAPWVKTLKTFGLCFGVVAFLLVLFFGVPSL